MQSFAIHPDRPGDDPIFALNHQATARAATGESIVNATIGVLLHDNGSLAVLPTAAHAMAEQAAEAWAPYAPISGEPAYLAAVQREVLEGAPDLERRAVSVATPGGSGAIRHAVCNFLEQGQSLLTSSFHWSPYGIIADEHGRGVSTFPMFDPARPGELHVAGFDRELARLMAAQKRALIVVNDPCHNPTGYSMTAADWTAVAERLAAHADKGPITILLDAAYAAYGASGLRLALAALEPISDRVLVAIAWSASKTFTHYGLRVGALTVVSPSAAERPRLVNALGYASRATWSNCNRGGMLAITRLLAEEPWATNVKRDRRQAVEMLGERVAAFNRAAKQAGIGFPKYDGGFFVTVFADDAKKASARTQERGVFVVPFQGGVRLALCAVPVRDIPRVVEAVAFAVR